MLLEDFRSDWIAEGRSATTAAQYVAQLKRWGVTDDPPTAEAVRAHIVKRLGEVTSQTVLVEVRAFKAYSRWWADVMDELDPLAKVKYPKVHASPPGKIADDGAIVALLSRFEAKTVLQNDGTTERTTFDTARLRALVVLVRDTGIRRGEIANLHLGDIDMKQRTILVRQPKGYQPRIVRISGPLRKELRRYLSRRAAHPFASLPHLFIGRSGALTPNGLGQVLRGACEKAGVHLTAHQFRRRMSLKWAEAGLSDDALRVSAGWRDDRMPAKYRAAGVQKLAFDQHRQLFG